MDLKELEAIAGRELLKHGLQGWTFGLGDTKRRLGVCKYPSKRIEVSEHHALHNSAELVLDTLMHEIAHAIAGPAARHGPAWKAVAIRLGATPRACTSSLEVAVTPGDWQATCPACKRTYHKYKSPKSVGGYSCKCPARSPLIFEFMGDPARKPVVPLTYQNPANWVAKCAGCQTEHRRTRRPKAGVWRCRCPHRCELVWEYRKTSAGPQTN